MKETELVNNTESNTEIFDIEKIKNLLFDTENTINIKWKSYINKKGYRKLAIAFNISIEVISESRIKENDITIYDFTVRATTQLWRFFESSASCSSNERDFAHLNHDVRATAQTRATNRAISDLLGITNLTYYTSWWNTNSDKIENKHLNNPVVSSNTTDTNLITQKQKKLLQTLISEVIENEEEQKSYTEILDELTKHEANFHIKELIDIKNGTN